MEKLIKFSKIEIIGQKLNHIISITSDSILINYILLDLS